MSRFIAYALCAADEALKDANWFPSEQEDKEKMGVSIGGEIESISDILDASQMICEKASSLVANIDEWKWKLSLQLHNEKDIEIISRDKRDRRDYERICNLAKRMGFYCQLKGLNLTGELPNFQNLHFSRIYLMSLIRRGNQMSSSLILLFWLNADFGRCDALL